MQIGMRKILTALIGILTITGISRSIAGSNHRVNKDAQPPKRTTMAGLAEPDADLGAVASRKMTNQEFQQCFDLLQKAGEGARSTVYAFVLIYGALLLWALNAVIYPAEQQRLSQVTEKAAVVIKCLVELENVKRADDLSDHCQTVLKDPSLDYRVKKAGMMAASPQAKQVDLVKIDSDYQTHAIQYQLDKSSETAKFTVPILGIASDRTWLWLINMALGPLFYYIIRDSFANLRYLLDYLYKNSVDQPRWLVLLSTTQILSSSTQKLTQQSNTADNEKSSLAKLTVLWLTFMLPLLVTGLLLYDWQFYFFSQDGDKTCSTNEFPNVIVRFLCVNGFRENYSDWFNEPEFFGGALTLAVFIAETFLFWQICVLFEILSRLHQKIRMSSMQSD